MLKLLFSVIRIVLLVAVLAVIGLVIWLRISPDGPEAAEDLTEHWQDFWHGAEARDAGEKLKAMNVRMARNNTEPYYSILQCRYLKIGDEGYGLVAKCFHLKTADFTESDINDERMKCLAGLSHLTDLDLSNNRAVTDAGIKNLASTPHLFGLTLNGTGITDEGLKQVGQLPQLKTLMLASTKITDAGLPSLNGLSELSWLVLSKTAVTDDGIAKLTGLKGLKEISVNETKVTSKGTDLLKKMYPGLKIDP